MKQSTGENSSTPQENTTVEVHAIATGEAARGDDTRSGNADQQKEKSAEDKKASATPGKLVIEPTDGRNQYEWQSRYSSGAIWHIRFETCYLCLLLIISLGLLFSCWYGCLFARLALSSGQVIVLRKYTFYAASGMLGGVVFGIKFFYRVVARGYWHLDRRIWRIMSPFLAMILAFASGVLIDANLFAIKGPSSPAAFVSIGFLTGYFADQANAKMCEIATVIFGANSSKN